MPFTYLTLCLINKGLYQFLGDYFAGSLAGSIPLTSQTLGTISGLKGDLKSPPDDVLIYVQIGLAVVKAGMAEDGQDLGGKGGIFFPFGSTAAFHDHHPSPPYSRLYQAVLMSFRSR